VYNNTADKNEHTPEEAITKEVSSQIEADYELLKIFIQKGDTNNALKTIDAIGIALCPDFLNAAFMKYSILLNAGLEEKAGKLAYNMDFLGVSKIAVLERVPSIKNNLADFFVHKEYIKMDFKPDITGEYINKLSLNENEKLNLNFIFKQFEEDRLNYEILKEIVLSRRMGSFDDFKINYAKDILVEYIQTVLRKELKASQEDPDFISVLWTIFSIEKLGPGKEALTFEEYLARDSKKNNNPSEESKKINYLIKTGDLIKAGKYLLAYFWSIYSSELLSNMVNPDTLSKNLYDTQEMYLFYKHFIFIEINV